jgi:hypothetical protein
MNSNPIARQIPVEIVNPSNWISIEPDNDVPFRQTRSLSGTLILHGYHQNATLHWKMEESHKPAMKGNILSPQTDIAPSDFAFLDELSSNKFGGIDGNGKTDSLSREDHCRIHADDLPPGIG